MDNRALRRVSYPLTQVDHRPFATAVNVLSRTQVCICGAKAKAPATHRPCSGQPCTLAVQSGQSEPQTIGSLNGNAAKAVGNTPAQSAQLIATEQTRLNAVIARAKIKPD